MFEWVGRWLSRIYNKRAGDYVLSLARIIRIALALFLGYVAWAGAALVKRGGRSRERLA